MEQKHKHFGLKIDPILHYKLRYVANYEGRSLSGQTIYVLRRYVQAFEERHGAIQLPQEKEQKRGQ